MKILMSSESYWPNNDGGAIFERRLVHQLINAGHQVCVVVPGNSWKSYEEVDGMSKIYRTASVRLPLNKDYKVSYFARSQVVKALDEFEPDIIHVHTMALTGMSLLKQAEKRHIPIVATNHLMPENVLMSLPKVVMNSEAINRQFWRTLVNFHDKFLAVSTPTVTSSNLLEDNGLKAPLFSITNGVDTDYFRPLKDGESKHGVLKRFKLPKRYMVYVGRVNAEKRLDMLIRSFALVSHSCPELNLVIAGTGNRSEELKNLSKVLGVNKRVFFLGRVSEEEKLALYQHAEFFGITSPAELQSIVTLEAEACGLPVIAVDIVALRELCHDSKNGFLIPLDDTTSFGKAIQKLYASAALRQKFGHYSRVLVVKRHSQDYTLKQYIEFYKFALKEAKESVRGIEHLV